MVQDGAQVRGAVLESNRGLRGELSGSADEHGLELTRRYREDGHLHEQRYRVAFTEQGAGLRGQVSEEGHFASLQFSATRLFPAPGAATKSGAPATAALLTPIDFDTLHQLVVAIDAEPFTETRLSVLRQGARGRSFTIEDVGRLLPLFNFETSKLEVLTLLRPQIVDPENGFKLDARFFSAPAKARAQKILAPH